MLDNGANRLLEFLRQIPCRLQVHNIVVRKLFPLKLPPIRHSSTGAIGIHCGLLVRVLSITEIGDLIERETQGIGKSAFRVEFEAPVRADPLQSRGNRGIISRRSRKCFLRQTPLSRGRQVATGFGQFLCNCIVICRRGDDGNILKILGGRTDHRRPANVDVLDQFFKMSPWLGRGFIEGIQIDHHHVDRFNTMFCNRGAVRSILPPMQDASMHLGM